MDRKPSTAFDLRQQAAWYRSLAEAGDYLAEHYQHLAGLLEEEANSWERVPLQPQGGC